MSFPEEILLRMLRARLVMGPENFERYMRDQGIQVITHVYSPPPKKPRIPESAKPSPVNKNRPAA